MPYFIIRENPPAILGLNKGYWQMIPVAKNRSEEVTVFWTLKEANIELQHVRKWLEPDAKVVHEGILERLDTLAAIDKQGGN